MNAAQRSTGAAHNNRTQKMKKFCSDCLIHCSTGARNVYPRMITKRLHTEADLVQAGVRVLRGIERQGGTSSSEDAIIREEEESASVNVTVEREDGWRRERRCAVVRLGADVGRGGVARES